MFTKDAVPYFNQSTEVSGGTDVFGINQWVIRQYANGTYGVRREVDTLDHKVFSTQEGAFNYITDIEYSF